LENVFSVTRKTDKRERICRYLIKATVSFYINQIPRLLVSKNKWVFTINGSVLHFLGHNRCRQSLRHHLNHPLVLAVFTAKQSMNYSYSYKWIRYCAEVRLEHDG